MKMENEGNSLLELPLETVEILGEVHIPTDNVGTVSETHVDTNGGMLIDEGTQSGLSAMETYSIDFEFVNTDLGTGTDFNIDNTNVFGITDNGMDAREDCEYLFRDTTCFDDTSTCVNKHIDASSLTHSSMVSIPNTGKLNLYKDLGLKLQVIPLNNLQYVSTIQTSKGLHILAIPSQATIPSHCDDVTIQQLCQKSKPIPSEPSGHQCLENRIQTISKFPTLKDQTTKSLTKIKAKNIMNDNVTDKDLFQSKSTRKLRDSMNKKLIICRNNSLKKEYVHNVFNRNSLINQRQDKNEGLGVVKSKNIRKHRMVSILNKSVTNRLKQTQSNGTMSAGKEIKVTFHLKPPIAGDNKKVTDNIPSKSPSDIFEQKSYESFEIKKQGALPRGEDVGELNHVNLLRISDSDQIASERNASAQAVNILDKNLASDQDKSREMHEKKNKEIHQVVDRNEQLQSLYENIKVLKTGTNLAEYKSVGKVFQCKVCLANFSRKGHFKNHMKTHMEMLTEPKDEVRAAIDNYNLDSKQFPESNTGKKKPSVCSNSEFGKETSRSESNFDVSEKKTIGLSKVFTCEFCDMSFKTPGNLTRHKLTHSLNVDKKVKGRYQCDDCGKRFMQKCDLKRHVITHSGTFPFTCTICEKGFIRQSDLNVHEKFHTQEKQYRCDLCSKAYFQTGDLCRHMRKCHVDECQFSCQICDKKYTTQKTLTIHMKTKH